MDSIQMKGDEKPIDIESRLDLRSWGLPEPVLKHYARVGVTKMFEWQAECLCTVGVLGGSNLVYSAPTSAGKTMVAELLILKQVLENKRKALFILPFVSVAREKMFSLQKLYQDAGIRVSGFMGSYNPPGGFSNIDVAVCTIEKGNSLINRLLQEDRVTELGTIVIDELHMVGDSGRGYLLELLLTKICYVAKKRKEENKGAENVQEKPVQIIGMSATLPNLPLLAKWLNAELYVTDYRPVPLTECVKVGQTVFDNNLEKKFEVNKDYIVPGDDEHLIPLSLQTVLNSHSVLIFCPTRSWCEKLCETIAREFYNIKRCYLSQEAKGAPNMSDFLLLPLDYNALNDVREQLQRTPTGLDNILGKTVPYGVAYHHAGLTFEERDIIEGAFRQCQVKVLVATSTLSSGVNLPARRVIIRTPIFHGQVIDTLVYKQMVGRAGRKGVDTEGESILICKESEKKKVLGLLETKLPPVSSCLIKDNELSTSFKRAVLEVVASGVAQSPKDVGEYVACTMLSASMENGASETTSTLIDSCLHFLQDNEFVALKKNTEGEDRFIPSQLGIAVLASALSPDEGLVVFADLQKARKCFVLESELHVIFLVTPIYSQEIAANIDWYQFYGMWENMAPDMKRVAELVGVEEAFICRAIRGRILTKTTQQMRAVAIHKRFYTALVLHELVNEKPLNDIIKKYHCNKGQLSSLQQTAATFAGMVTVFCGKLGWHNLELILGQFQNRLTFGVQRELCDLVRITALNAQRARCLYNAGYQTVASLANADPNSVENAFLQSMAFQSNKTQEGESEWEAEKRRQCRCIYLGGRTAVTIMEAAITVVDEAKTIIQEELGGVGIQWSGPTTALNTTTHKVNQSFSFVTPTGRARSSKKKAESSSGKKGKKKGRRKKKLITSPSSQDDKNVIKKIVLSPPESYIRSRNSSFNISGHSDSSLFNSSRHDDSISLLGNKKNNSFVNTNGTKILNLPKLVGKLESIAVNQESVIPKVDLKNIAAAIGNPSSRSGKQESLLKLNSSEKLNFDLNEKHSISEKVPSVVEDSNGGEKMRSANYSFKHSKSFQNKPDTNRDVNKEQTTVHSTISNQVPNSSQVLKNSEMSNRYQGKKTNQISNSEQGSNSNEASNSNQVSNNNQAYTNQEKNSNQTLKSYERKKTNQVSNSNMASSNQGSNSNEASNSNQMSNNTQTYINTTSKGSQNNQQSKLPVSDEISNNLGNHTGFVPSANKENTLPNQQDKSKLVCNSSDVKLPGNGCNLNINSCGPTSVTQSSEEMKYQSKNQKSSLTCNLRISTDKKNEIMSPDLYTDGMSLNESDLNMLDLNMSEVETPREIQSNVDTKIKRTEISVEESLFNESLALESGSTSLVASDYERRNTYNDGAIMDESIFRSENSFLNLHLSNPTQSGAIPASKCESLSNSKLQEGINMIMNDDSFDMSVSHVKVVNPKQLTCEVNNQHVVNALTPKVRNKNQAIGNMTPIAENTIHFKNTSTPNFPESVDDAKKFSAPNLDVPFLKCLNSPNVVSRQQGDNISVNDLGDSLTFSMIEKVLESDRKNANKSGLDLDCEVYSTPRRQIQSGRNLRKRRSQDKPQTRQSKMRKNDDTNSSISDSSILNASSESDVVPPTPPDKKSLVMSPCLRKSFRISRLESPQLKQTQKERTPVSKKNQSQKSPVNKDNHFLRSSAKKPEIIEHNNKDGGCDMSLDVSKTTQTQQYFSIIDVCSNYTLFQTFIKEWKTKKRFSLCVACEPKPKKPLATGLIGQNFHNQKLSNQGEELDMSIRGEDIDNDDRLIVGLAVSWENRDVYYIALSKSNLKEDPDDTLLAFSLDQNISLLDKLSAVREVMDNHDSTWVAFDIKSQFSVIVRGCGVVPKTQLEDPKIGNWLFDPDAKEKNLHGLVTNSLPQDVILLDRIGGCTGTGSLGLLRHTSISGRFRASTESVLAIKLMDYFQEKLKSENLLKTFHDVEMPSIITLTRMELNGFGFSDEECEHQKKLMSAKLAQLESDAYKLAGHPFSLTSTDDIAQVLYLELHLPVNGDPNVQQIKTLGPNRRSVKRRGKPQYSTAKDVLEKLKSFHALPGVILEWRRISMTLTKQVFPLQREKIYCERVLMDRIFGVCQVHTSTGRVSMREPNIQNIPKDFQIDVPDALSENGRKSSSNKEQVAVSMRHTFIPYKGCVMLAADYSQLELRVIAHLSQDKKLIGILNSNQDVFKQIAGQWLNLTPEQVSTEQRQQAKQICYGMLYGIGPKALGEQIGVDENEAGVFMETFKAKYPGLRKYLQSTVENCKKDCYVETITGRKRHLSSIKSTNIHARAQAERQAVNTTVQGSAADIVKIAMNNIDRKLQQFYPDTQYPHSYKYTGKNQQLPYGAFLLLQLHDELIYEVSKNEVDKVSKLVQHEMESAVKLSVKLQVKVKTGRTWASLEEN